MTTFPLVNGGVYRRGAAALTLTRLHFSAIPGHPDLSSAPHDITRPKAAACLCPGGPEELSPANSEP